MTLPDDTYSQLLSENEALRLQLEEATDAIEAIRTGQVDALVVNDGRSHQLFTLKTADQTYRVFIEKMNEGAVTISHEGLILYSNSRFASMVSMPLEKVIGMAFRGYISEAYLQAYDNLIDAAWREDSKEEMELNNPNRGIIPCLLSCSTLVLDEGVALSLILTDLSILKEAEKQLKIKNLQLVAAHEATEKLNDELEYTVRARTNELTISREHFKYLANNIPQMTWTNLPNGEVDYYNDRWYDYTGLNFDETKKWGWQDVVHPDDLPLTPERYVNSLQKGEIFVVENRYRKADGTFRWHLNRALPLKDDTGHIVFWVGTATDIEDQKKEMEKRDEFIGIASHELKTPLTSLKGYLQIIITNKKEPLPERLVPYAEKANKAINKLQSLINDLLDVSKIQAGKLDYAFTAVNMADLVKACIENADYVYPGSDFSLEDGHEFLVNANADRLEQVLNNLIGNAVKYSHGEKKVVLKIEQIAERVRVSVIDFGIGLSDNQKERIFERFYRVEDKKYLTSGLGMGLYIAAQIIHNHHGEIGVESELGKGSTFYFELPLLEAKI